jgi:hypothetical protein
MTADNHDGSEYLSRTLAFTLTRGDVRQLSRYIHFGKKPFWTVARLLIYGALVVWGLDWFRIEVGVRMAAGNPAAMLGIALGTPPLLLGLLLLFITAVQLIAAQTPKPADRRITLTHHGVLSEQSEGSIVMSWASFIEIARDGHAIYGFMTSTFAIILPRRAFEDAAEMDEWYREMARIWEERRHEPTLPPPPANAISVTYAASVKDYEKAFSWAASRAPGKARLIRAAIPMIGVVLILVLNAREIARSPEIVILLAPCLLLLFCVSYGLVRYRPRIVARQIAHVRGGLTPQTLSLAPEGLISRSATAWSQFPWRQILKIESDRDLIYFLLPGGHATFVPLGAFLDRSEADAFLSAARSYQAGQVPQTEEGAVWPPKPQA